MSGRSRVWAFISVSAFCSATGLLAGGQQLPSFRASTEAVPLLVAVTTPDGGPVADLTVDDFQVLDDGRRAELVAFSPRAAPVAFRLLVAQIPGLRKEVPRVREFAHALIEKGLPSEEIGVGGASLNNPRYLNGASAFTTDKAVLLQEFETKFEMTTPESLLYWADQLSEAVWSLQASAKSVAPPSVYLRAGEPMWASGQLPSVRAVVVLSPGMDRYGDDAGESWLRKARLGGAIIYGLGFGGRSPDKRLAKIATATSGWYLEHDKRLNLSGEADRILTDLRNRYVLGFVPVAFDGKEHTLSVKVRRPGVVVRAMTAYLAPKQTPAG